MEREIERDRHRYMERSIETYKGRAITCHNDTSV